MTYAQHNVRGNINDEYGEAIIGASILEKGTTNGTVTDVDGQFSLSVPLGATLQISSCTVWILGVIQALWLILYTDPFNLIAEYCPIIFRNLVCGLVKL